MAEQQQESRDNMQRPEMAPLPNGSQNQMSYSANFNPSTNGQTWWLNGNQYVQQKEELPQNFPHGVNVYNQGSANGGAMNGAEGLAHAFGGLNMYSPGSGNIGKPNNNAMSTAFAFPANNARLSNSAYYTLFTGNPNGQNGFQRGATPFNSQQQSQYPQPPGPPNGNTAQGTIQGAIWNGPNQQPNDVPELAAPRRTSLSSNEENGPQTPFFAGHAGAFYPKVTVPDNSPQTWGTPSPQQLGQSLAMQAPLWRDSEHKQYILKDLDAICSEDPSIPRPIPAIFSDDKARGTLETSLENKNHTTNVYIRGLHPNTTDEMLVAYGARFGLISSAKSMIDQHTGLCKGFGFIKYHNYADGENCIRGFFHWGYEAKWARDSNNEKLKKLSDEDNTNLYISNLPTEHDFNEHMLMAIFTDFECLSAKILRDLNGLSRGVGFARFASPEVCRAIIEQYNGKRVGEQSLPISIRFADTPEQKRLKALTQERRQYKTHEYNVAAFGPNSPYSQYPGVFSAMSSPLQSRATVVNGQYGQLSYGFPYGSSSGASPIALPVATAPAVKISGAENTPLGSRSQVLPGLGNSVDVQTQAKGEPQVKVEASAKGDNGPQLAVQPPGKLEPQVSVDSEAASALSKRNPNVPSPTKIKKEFAAKATANLGHEVENVSLPGSNTSSPIKNTPSKAPKASFARA